MSKDELPFENDDNDNLSFQEILNENMELKIKLKYADKQITDLKKDVITVYNHLVKSKELNIKLLEDKVKLEREGK